VSEEEKAKPQKGEYWMCLIEESMHNTNRMSVVGEIFHLTDSGNYFHCKSVVNGDPAFVTSKNFEKTDSTVCGPSIHEKVQNRCKQIVMDLVEHWGITDLKLADVTEADPKTVQPEPEQVISQQIVGTDIITTTKRKGTHGELTKIRQRESELKASRAKRDRRRLGQRAQGQIEGAREEPHCSEQADQGDRCGDSGSAGSDGRGGRRTGVGFDARDVTNSVRPS